MDHSLLGCRILPSDLFHSSLTMPNPHTRVDDGPMSDAISDIEMAWYPLRLLKQRSISVETTSYQLVLRDETGSINARGCRILMTLSQATMA
jgi:hypothetical protein